MSARIKLGIVTEETDESDESETIESDDNETDNSLGAVD